MSYRRFGSMIAASSVVMFALMYLNTYQLDHVFFSPIGGGRRAMRGCCPLQHCRPIGPAYFFRVVAF